MPSNPSKAKIIIKNRYLLLYVGLLCLGKQSNSSAVSQNIDAYPKFGEWKEQWAQMTFEKLSGTIFLKRIYKAVSLCRCPVSREWEVFFEKSFWQHNIHLLWLCCSWKDNHTFKSYSMLSLLLFMFGMTPKPLKWISNDE